jgi:hypothetical protein
MSTLHRKQLSTGLSRMVAAGIAFLCLSTASFALGGKVVRDANLKAE